MIGLFLDLAVLYGILRFIGYVIFPISQITIDIFMTNYVVFWFLYYAVPVYGELAEQWCREVEMRPIIDYLVNMQKFFDDPENREHFITIKSGERLSIFNKGHGGIEFTGLGPLNLGWDTADLED